MRTTFAQLRQFKCLSNLQIPILFVLYRGMNKKANSSSTAFLVQGLLSQIEALSILEEMQSFACLLNTPSAGIESWFTRFELCLIAST